MDRAAKLAEEARIFLHFERDHAHKLDAEPARACTREALVECAAELGFSPLEISAAVDQALKDAGTTP